VRSTFETDAVASGWAANLSRPGGNITGIFLDQPELAGESLQFLKEIVPAIFRVAVPWDVATHQAPLRATEAVARPFAVRLDIVEVRGAQNVDGAVRAAVKAGTGSALLTLPSTLMDVEPHRKLIAELTLKNRMPTVAWVPSFVKAGGLISYGADLGHSFQELAPFIDKILNGVPPGELPLQRPSGFHLAVNLKTAKALGLTIPQLLLMRADHVIE
jgi:ABC-type uncharacterized transport system substrate-binding protein